MVCVDSSVQYVQQYKKYSNIAVFAKYHNMIVLRNIELNLKATPIHSALHNCYCILTHPTLQHFTNTVPCLDGRYRWSLNREAVRIDLGTHTHKLEVQVINYQDCARLYCFQIVLGINGSQDKNCNFIGTYDFNISNSRVTLSIEYTHELSLRKQRLQRLKRLAIAKKTSATIMPAIDEVEANGGSMLRRVSSAKLIPTRERRQSELGQGERVMSMGEINLRRYREQEMTVTQDGEVKPVS